MTDKDQPLLILKLLQRPGTHWENTLGKMRYLNNLTEELKTILPEPLKFHCQVANVTEITVTLCTDASAWSARLRFLEPAIRAFFQQKLGPATWIIQYRITAPAGSHSYPALHKASLSDESRTQLAQAAESIQDPKLKGILLRLSQQKTKKV